MFARITSTCARISLRATSYIVLSRNISRRTFQLIRAHVIAYVQQEIFYLVEIFLVGRTSYYVRTYQLIRAHARVIRAHILVITSARISQYVRTYQLIRAHVLNKICFMLHILNKIFLMSPICRRKNLSMKQGTSFSKKLGRVMYSFLWTNLVMVTMCSKFQLFIPKVS